MQSTTSQDPLWLEEASKIIKQFEGLKLQPYDCPAGKQTIGYGHVLEAKELSFIIKSITPSNADFLLAQDIYVANGVVDRLIRVPLNDYQRAALISFTFNVGAGALQASTLRSKLNRREYYEAAEQFTRWVNVKGKPLKGLLRRRYAERALFLREEKDIVPRDIIPLSNTKLFKKNNNVIYPPPSLWKQAAAVVMGAFKWGH